MLVGGSDVGSCPSFQFIVCIFALLAVVWYQPFRGPSAQSQIEKLNKQVFFIRNLDPATRADSPASPHLRKPS